jgi:hypothetical protein
MLENTSQSKSVDLSNWTIRQDNNNGDILIFIFPDNCLLRGNHSLKVRKFNLIIFYLSFYCIRF